MANFTSAADYYQWESKSVLTRHRLSFEEILQGLDVTCYINDLGISINGTFDKDLKLVDKFLQRIAESNLQTNPLKCNWGVKQTDFLGYEMTSASCKPMNKKIDALRKMSAPSNQKQVRSFLVAINFCKSILPRHTSLTLSPGSLERSHLIGSLLANRSLMK